MKIRDIKDKLSELDDDSELVILNYTGSRSWDMHILGAEIWPSADSAIRDLVITVTE